MNEPLRVAIVGCGAVAHVYYAPALAALEHDGTATVVAAFDPDTGTASAFCSRLDRARAVSSLDAVIAAHPDVVVIASSPRYHAEQTVAAVSGGCDVFCEKPLAIDRAQGENMVAAAATAGRRVFVGLVRRQFPATRAIHRLVRSGALGDIRSVECFEGGPFAWPVRSTEYFRPVAGNGGVLQDIGTHCLDLLVWWLGAPTSLSYADDAMGGVEANCSIDLAFGSAQVKVRLSRDWARPNRYVLRGDRGWIAWNLENVDRLELGFDDEIVGDLTLEPAPLPDAAPARRPVGPRIPFGFEGAFAAQLRALASGRTEVLVDAVEALPVLDVIDRCTAERSTMPMPWMVPDGAV